MIRFHATNQNRCQVGYDELEDWLAEQFAKNAPWDEIAAATDHRHRPRTTRTARSSFALAHEAKPVELAGEVSRIFLGRADPVRPVPRPPDRLVEAAAVPRVRRLLRRRTVAGRSSKACRGQLPVFEVVAQGRPRYTMPDKEDPQKQIPVAPRFFLAARRGDRSPPA